MPKSFWIACESSEEHCGPLLDKRCARHLQLSMYWLTNTSAVRAAKKNGTGDGVERKMATEAVTVDEKVEVAAGGEGKGSKVASKETTSPEPLGRGRESVGQPSVCREVLRASHLRQRRIHQRVGVMGHARPPVETLKEVGYAHDADVAGVIRMAGVHHPRAHDHGYMDAPGGGGGESVPLVGGSFRGDTFVPRGGGRPTSKSSPASDGPKDGGGEVRGEPCCRY